MAKLLDFGFTNIDLWRSEEMQLVQLMIPAESAHDTIFALGDIGLLQFKDLNADKSAFQRTFAGQVKRCDEMARRLRFFHEQVEKAGLVVKARAQEKTYEFDELEAKLEELEKELVETNGNMERLQRSYAELVELQLVLERAGAFFDSKKGGKFEIVSESFGDFNDGESPLLEAVGGDKVAKVGFVAGTIQQEKLNSFERLLFRATRGNMYLRQVPVGLIRDPATGEEQDKSVFVIFFAGERSRTKVHKICEVFGANRYPFPEEVARQRQMAAEVTGRLRELHTTNEAGERRRDTVLKDIALSLEEWTTLVRKEKAVYHTLNKLSVDVTSKVLIAEAWVPAYAKQQVQDVLTEQGQASSAQLGAILQPLTTSEMPPTYFRTTKFTQCFQSIVEAYGIARYREVNPTVLTLMTFPFLFAVMFGDVGHAIIMLMFAGFLVIKESQLMKQDLGDMLGMLFAGRYCILVMSIYSLYTGILYNEFFSMPMAIFGDTNFKCLAIDPYRNNRLVLNMTMAEEAYHHEPEVDEFGYAAIDIRDCKRFGGKVMWPHQAKPYVFGMDPIWHGRKTELPFFNSFKMKMSIILGVLHMDFGIMNSLYNNLYFRDTLSTVWEFIPQMIFLNFIFGYLSILIITKWFTACPLDPKSLDRRCVADLYRVMINMFLSPGYMPEGDENTPADKAFLFHGQGKLQVFLLLISFIAVPCMLLPKPLILKKRHEALQRSRGAVELAHGGHGYGGSAQDDDVEGRRPGHSDSGHGNGGGHGGHGHGEFEFGEVMVHQMIHTIEFVLGAVSNTASYLRLWALSLAHSQLSGVFYDRVLMMGLQMNSIPAMFIGFFVFACATLGVLMVMESLSAFLHALRLHWVEYQNKFYKGDGYKFAPFSFEAILKTKDEDDKAA